MSDKFPRIPHLPWSPGGTADDRCLKSVAHFLGEPLVITEKIDGSNLCFTHDAVFARSHSRPPVHPSFDMAKAIWARSRSKIPSGFSLFAEWAYAKHSIHYAELPGYLLAIAVRHDSSGVWGDWSGTASFATKLGFPTVPVVWEGRVQSAESLRELVDRLGRGPSRCGGQCEGVVVRMAGDFTAPGRSMAKWVRTGHVRTGDHWTRGRVVRNALRASIK